MILIPIFAFGQEVVAVDSGYVEVKKGKLFYKIFGEGEPVLFINNGGGFASKNYEIYADLLSKNCMFIMFDQRGTGKSIQLFNGMIRRSWIAKDLEVLRKHLKLEEWIVFGNSGGGNFASYYASRYPQRTKKLILASSPKISNNFFESDTQRFKVANIDNLSDKEYEIYEKLVKLTDKVEPDQELLGRCRLAMQGRYYVSKPENYDKAVDWLFKFKFESNSFLQDVNVRKMKHRLSYFHNPVLIIHGQGDFFNIACPLENEKIFNKVKLSFIEDCGHLIIFDQPEQFVKEFEAFIEG